VRQPEGGAGLATHFWPSIGGVGPPQMAMRSAHVREAYKETIK